MVAFFMAELEYTNMRVYTKIVFDIESGDVLESESYEYNGPVALCDRGLQSTAQQAANTDTSTASGYGKTASGLSGFLTPMLESWAGGNAPGYGDAGVSAMKNAAQSTAGAAANAGNEQGLLTAMRTNNAAGVGAEEVANAANAGQTQTNAVQNILSQNAQLKAQEQTGAMNMLGSMYGTDVGAQLTSQGQVPGAINAGVNAGNSGWFQNTLNGLNTLGGLGKGAGAVMTGAGAMR